MTEKSLRFVGWREVYDFKAYEAKKAKKPAGIAKSNIIFDVKPWDDSIDVAEIEKKVRGIETDGLVWGTAKVLPIAYGINKLQVIVTLHLP